MVEAYWHIGQQIVKEEQRGKDRVKYGSYLIKELSQKLTVQANNHVLVKLNDTAKIILQSKYSHKFFGTPGSKREFLDREHHHHAR